MAEQNLPGQLWNLERQVVSFESMAELTTHDERKRALLKKCDDVYAVAQMGRVSARGKGVPDCHAMLKCVELAARLMGVLREAERRAMEGDQDSRAADIEQVAGLLRSVGYKVEKAA